MNTYRHFLITSAALKQNTFIFIIATFKSFI